MFARDFHLLNQIYNQQIINENVGMGPNADNPVISVVPVRTCLKCDRTKAKCSCDEAEENELIIAGDHEVPTHDHETNAYMAKQQLFRIIKLAYMLHDIICDKEDLEPWLADKIGRAHDGLNSVFAYKDYEHYRDQLDNDEEIEEGTDRDLVDSINRGGDTIVGQIRKVIRNESRETVERVLLEAVKALELKK